MFWPKRPSNYYALPLQDNISFIRRSIHAFWQSPWDQYVSDGNKLAQLKPSLDPWSSCSQQCHHLEVSLSHLCIGHTHLTHSHLTAREAPLICDYCQVLLSISHILVECPTYSVPSNRFFYSLISVPPCECLYFLLFNTLHLPPFCSMYVF